ncbi:sporulation protein [Robertmurraya sp. FSL R5-0851]|uniref:sporulation protein n=1 Tax=Robertmurraya sp. FSL R5-0851 TaxID=2921584 RepID=UPI0030F756EC
MSLFNKVFASIGIGSATVDTKLEKDVFVPGEEIRGIVQIKGGKIEQLIDDIYLNLHTNYLKESDDKKHIVKGDIERFRLIQAVTIGANETKEIPFVIRVPFDTPISIGRTKVWVETGLDIKNAVDPTDKDYIKVVPNQLMKGVLDTVAELGFRLREADCEELPYRKRRRLPFAQEFEFAAVSGSFRGKLDELEVIFFPQSDEQMDLALQIDRKARGLGGFLAEALEMDETNISVSIHSRDLPTLKSKLESLIRQYS